MEKFEYSSSIIARSCQQIEAKGRAVAQKRNATKQQVIAHCILQKWLFMRNSQITCLWKKHYSIDQYYLFLVVVFSFFCTNQIWWESFPILSARLGSYIISKYDEVNTVLYLFRALRIVSCTLHLFTHHFEGRSTFSTSIPEEQLYLYTKSQTFYVYKSIPLVYSSPSSLLGYCFLPFVEFL